LPIVIFVPVISCADRSVP